VDNVTFGFILRGIVESNSSAVKLALLRSVIDTLLTFQPDAQSDGLRTLIVALGPHSEAGYDEVQPRPATPADQEPF
jgi:hypothetical protein